MSIAFDFAERESALGITAVHVQDRVKACWTSSQGAANKPKEMRLLLKKLRPPTGNGSRTPLLRARIIHTTAREGKSEEAAQPLPATYPRQTCDWHLWPHFLVIATEEPTSTGFGHYEDLHSRGALGGGAISFSNYQIRNITDRQGNTSETGFALTEPGAEPAGGDWSTEGSLVAATLAGFRAQNRVTADATFDLFLLQTFPLLTSHKLTTAILLLNRPTYVNTRCHVFLLWPCFILAC